LLIFTTLIAFGLLGVFLVGLLSKDAEGKIGGIPTIRDSEVAK
jgi:hypothetical protein